MSNASRPNANAPNTGAPIGAQGSTNIGSSSAGSTAMVTALQQELTQMRSIIEEQQKKIDELASAASTGSQPSDNLTAPAVQPPTVQVTQQIPSSKVVPINVFNGNKQDQTSTRVKAFIYRVKKAGTMAGMKEDGLIALADCYLGDRAATWMTSLERSDQKPTTIDDLEKAMIQEFVPADEKARAKTRLMQLRMTRSADSYISTFRDLVEICETPLSESYLFFFNGLTDEFKEEFQKKYPTGEPMNLQDVFEHARTLETARQWNKRGSRHKDRKGGSYSKGRNGSRNQDNRKSGKQFGKKNKDPNSEYWGPAEPKEKDFYRKNNRCYGCGGKWTFDHECKNDQGSSRDGNPPTSASPNE